jgi:hypothetical protein
MGAPIDKVLSESQAQQHTQLRPPLLALYARHGLQGIIAH